MSSFATEQHGFGAAMRDFGTVLVVAATGTFNGVLGLLRYATEGDPFWLWASAALLWASGALAGYGLLRLSRRRALNRGETRQ
jgi:hypothetical protein